MVTERLQHMIDTVTKLPPEKQDRVVALVEEALQHVTTSAPLLTPEWRESVERAMQEQAETLEYLKDK